MTLGLHTDYGLRTLIFLASCQERTSVARVAEFYGISRDHVAKVVQSLAKLGYVRSIRGVGGGIELGQPAEEINVGEVILALEGSLRLLECVDRPGVCAIQPGCQLRQVLAEAERLQVEYLKTIRLTDIIRPGRPLVELTLPAADG